MNPVIDWATKTVMLSRTKKSDLIKIDVDNDRKKAKLPLLFNHPTPKWKNSKLPRPTPLPFIATPIKENPPEGESLSALVPAIAPTITPPPTTPQEPVNANDTLYLGKGIRQLITNGFQKTISETPLEF
ncbi:hypothetical protein BDR04DRAFT_1159015 [Suillus decipiens]|nr:hypothetical protein BDR04DRAFT_1159015 [Suillus decipiens]